jgi:tRNA wybutosine-synthesizing protein 2
MYYTYTSTSTISSKNMPGKGNPLHNALRSCLEILPSELLASLELMIDTILTSTPKTFSIYEPLLLLPAHTFSSPQWTSLSTSLSTSQRDTFYKHLAIEMKVTHIALNSPITLSTTTAEGEMENLQRRPNITPLHGVFGPFLATPHPSTIDFSEAFWVSTRQNGILQTWAPLYTMFSRGNINEKARLLSLPTVSAAVAEDGGCTAVDLYAGIGYFVFSYAKAGVDRVLGWEINGWSVEGLRRGAINNRWDVSVVSASEEEGWIVSEEKIVVFQMSNDTAVQIVERNRNALPPVRHVNLGLLPSSRQGYEIAVRCIDIEMGGWLHVHENFGVKEIEERATDVVREISALAQYLKGRAWTVQLEHVEKVKTYAPGVMHCVLDIHVQPSG